LGPGVVDATPGRGGKMKFHTEYLTFDIPSKMAFVNITAQVQDAVTKKRVLVKVIGE
jgi:hypothetical protein